MTIGSIKEFCEKRMAKLDHPPRIKQYLTNDGVTTIRPANFDILMTEFDEELKRYNGDRSQTTLFIETTERNLRSFWNLYLKMNAKDKVMTIAQMIIEGQEISAILFHTHTNPTWAPTLLPKMQTRIDIVQRKIRADEELEEMMVRKATYIQEDDSFYSSISEPKTNFLQMSIETNTITNKDQLLSRL